MEPVTGQLVSGEFFPVLGVRPALGRLLNPSDNRSLGQHSVLVLSYSYWQRRFSGKADVLGSILPLNGNPFTIVGVAEAGFFGVAAGDSPDLWLPLLMQAEVRYAQNAWSSNADTRKPWPPQEGIRWLDAMIRVPDPRAVPAVEARLNVLYHQDMERAGQVHDERERRVLLERRLSLEQGAQGFSTLRRQFSTPLRLLMTAVGLVLLIACANIASLLLARAMARRKEIAIRLSIGAGRTLLVRQLLTESVVLALLGGILGVLIASWSNHALPRLFSIDVHLRLDSRVLAFAAGLSLATGILFGLAPAFRITSVEPGAALKSGTSADSPGRRLTLGNAGQSWVALACADAARVVRRRTMTLTGCASSASTCLSVCPGPLSPACHYPTVRAHACRPGAIAGRVSTPAIPTAPKVAVINETHGAALFRLEERSAATRLCRDAI